MENTGTKALSKSSNPVFLAKLKKARLVWYCNGRREVEPTEIICTSVE